MQSQEHEGLLGFHKVAAAEADQHLEAMSGLNDDEVARYVRDIFNANVLVFGIFSDQAELAGVGAILIKGREAALTMRDTGRLPDNFTATALQFQSRAQAEAVWAAWDGAAVKPKRRGDQPP